MSEFIFLRKQQRFLKMEKNSYRKIDRTEHSRTVDRKLAMLELIACPGESPLFGFGN